MVTAFGIPLDSKVPASQCLFSGLPAVEQALSDACMFLIPWALSIPQRQLPGVSPAPATKRLNREGNLS
jgi:hypothetical protein